MIYTTKVETNAGGEILTEPLKNKVALMKGTDWAYFAKEINLVCANVEGNKIVVDGEENSLIYDDDKESYFVELYNPDSIVIPANAVEVLGGITSITIQIKF